MREIKFRAWNGGKMVFQNLTSNSGISIFFGSLERNAEIMQYTGLKDKNGKEIYEGDILLIPDEWTEPILDYGQGPTEPFNHLAEVMLHKEWATFGLTITESGNWYDKGFCSFEGASGINGLDKFEVIGNIHENPELLEK